MPEVDLYTAAATEDWISAGVAIAVAFVAARLVDRAIAKRGARVGELVGRGELSPAMQTRLRMIRRLVYALFLLIGFAIAASRFDEVSSVAKGVLASSAVLGLVLGFGGVTDAELDRALSAIAGGLRTHGAQDAATSGHSPTGPSGPRPESTRDR
jgi:hypothetical protein